MICSNCEEKISEETKGIEWVLEELQGAMSVLSLSSLVCVFFHKNSIRRGDNVVS